MSGFDVAFVMPSIPVNRALSRSPYAVTAYDQINPALGNIDELTRWIKECRRLGIRVVLDVPLNHTSPAHHWMDRPDFYQRDAAGKMHPPLGTEWNDVLQLNHAHPNVQQALADVIRFWTSLGFDGFRYDAASFMPSDALEKLIEVANNYAQKELLHWCDSGETYFRVRGMTAFLDHDGVRRLLSGESIKSLLQGRHNDGIFYLTNHDSLHQQGSALQQWGKSYPEVLKLLLDEKLHVMQTFAEWRNPSSVYSFLA